MLRHSGAGLTMGHLADQFGTQASVITYRLDRLEKRGLAKRSRGEKDFVRYMPESLPWGGAVRSLLGPVHITSVRKHFIDHVPREKIWRR